MPHEPRAAVRGEVRRDGLMLALDGGDDPLGQSAAVRPPPVGQPTALLQFGVLDSQFLGEAGDS